MRVTSRKVCLVTKVGEAVAAEELASLLTTIARQSYNCD
jgi:hypothetical protein